MDERNSVIIVKAAEEQGGESPATPASKRRTVLSLNSTTFMGPRSGIMPAKSEHDFPYGIRSSQWNVSWNPRTSIRSGLLRVAGALRAQGGNQRLSGTEFRKRAMSRGVSEEELNWSGLHPSQVADMPKLTMDEWHDHIASHSPRFHVQFEQTQDQRSLLHNPTVVKRMQLANGTIVPMPGWPGQLLKNDPQVKAGRENEEWAQARDVANSLSSSKYTGHPYMGRPVALTLSLQSHPLTHINDRDTGGVGRIQVRRPEYQQLASGLFGRWLGRESSTTPEPVRNLSNLTEIGGITGSVINGDDLWDDHHDMDKGALLVEGVHSRWHQNKQRLDRHNDLYMSQGEPSEFGKYQNARRLELAKHSDPDFITASTRPVVINGNPEEAQSVGKIADLPFAKSGDWEHALLKMAVLHAAHTGLLGVVLPSPEWYQGRVPRDAEATPARERPRGMPDSVWEMYQQMDAANARRGGGFSLSEKYENERSQNPDQETLYDYENQPVPDAIRRRHAEILPAALKRIADDLAPLGAELITHRFAGTGENLPYLRLSEKARKYLLTHGMNSFGDVGQKPLLRMVKSIPVHVKVI